MKVIYWLPRILSIGFILFLSLFALDIFSEYTGLATILPLLIHLLPSLVLLAVTALAWKYDLIGAIIYLGFALFYIFAAGLDRPWSWYAGIAGPSALVGVLYLLSWRQGRKSGKGLTKQG